MDKLQKRVFLVVVAISLAYFTIFIIPNLRGAQSESMLKKTSEDESAMYPFLVRMLTPASDLKDLFSRWVIYGDYHYGYPYYFLSAVVVLPVRLIYGARFTDYPPLNLLLVRQLISILPMVIAIVLLVYMQTGFKSYLRSVGLLLILLSLRAVVVQNLQWWHPDALSVLAVVLTLFFLNRDRLVFGKNFYLAAVMCGLATSIKLAGPFFFLTIASYLIAGWVKRRASPRKLLLSGFLFLVLMLAALVISNPFLYNAGARQDLMYTQRFKAEQLSQGYLNGDDPRLYSKGPVWWEWTLRTWYAHPLFLAFVLLSLLAGCIWGPNSLLQRLILTWIIPYSIYLLYFVAVKPGHFWLPIMLPLFSAGIGLPSALKEGLLPWFAQHKRTSTALSLLVCAVLVGFVAINIARPFSGAYVRYTEALAVEQNLPSP